MNNINDFFTNKFEKSDQGIYLLDREDSYVKNFGKQWKNHNKVQIDSYNNFQISKNFLKKIIFDDLYFLKGKKILEIGWGAGRFTEYLAPLSSICVSIDLSSSIYYNVAINEKNLILAKADFLKLISKNKFDIVICRGVLQHTPNPMDSILKLYEFVNNEGLVFFDIYPMPKIGLLHPKYFFWRPLLTRIFTYENFEIFLKKNIVKLLFLKRILKLIFFNSNFFSDIFIPVWDYKGKIKLNNQQLNDWAILDTLDGIFAKYDNPIRKKTLLKFLKNNNIQVLKKDLINNIYKTKI